VLTSSLLLPIFGKGAPLFLTIDAPKGGLLGRCTFNDELAKESRKTDQLILLSHARNGRCFVRMIPCERH
jgi:hypothetical protein